MADFGPLRPPTLDDIDAIARRAYANLPAQFRALCEGLVIQIAEFADEETLREMHAESAFDILGLFRGSGLAHAEATPQSGALPNMIWLYRQPLLAYWQQGEDSLEAVVAHVLIHEIGHHFGLSDDDMYGIEGRIP